MYLKLRSVFALGVTFLSAAMLAQTTRNVPGDYPTIQSAVNASVSGDTVLVQPGTYQENVVITGIEITLTSAGGSSQTTIDGQALGAVITVNNTPSLKTTIAGFTLQNGRSGSDTHAAGVELNIAGATIINNQFIGNLDAVSVQFGAVSFSNNQVSMVILNGTQCESGTGIYFLAGNNTSVLDASGKLAGSSIVGNTFSAVGKCAGNIGVDGSPNSSLLIQGNTISGGNEGIYISPSFPVQILDNIISGNQTGGLFLGHATVVPAADPADVFVVNNTFVNNLAGAKSLSSGSAGPAEVAVTGTFSKVALINNVFSTVSASNPIIDCQGAASSSTNAVTPMIMDHNLFWNSATGGKLGLDGCPVTVGTFGNINANPQFVSTTNFQLATGSPAIDVGNNSGTYALGLTHDLAGALRIQDATGLANQVVDMGAYEANGTTTSTSVINATASSYYLISGNSFTISASLLNALYDGSGNTSFSYTPEALQTLTFTGTGQLPVSVVTDATGSASVPYTIATPGAYAFTVSYAGGTYGPATSVVLWVYVTTPLAVTTLNLTSSQNPSLVGSSVTFTATSNATNGTHPTPLTLSDNGTVLTTINIGSSGTGTYTTNALSLGSHPLSVTFAGDTTRTPGVATLTQVVGNFTTTSTALSSSGTPSTYGQSVTFTAKVTAASGVPTGTVTFLDGTTQLGAPVTVSGTGTATYTTTTLTVGTHNLTANYTATGSYAGSSGTFTQVVTGIPTKSVLTLSATSVTAGTNVTLTATVTVPSLPATVPTGTVTFYDGTAVLGTATVNGNGVASFVLNTVAETVGNHSLGCTYNGGGTLASSTCMPVTLTITAIPVTLTVISGTNPSTFGQSVTFIANVSSGSGVPTGTITFADGSTALGSPVTVDGSGNASLSTALLAVGAHAINATFAPTNNFGSGSGSVMQNVYGNGTSTVLSATPASGLYGTSVAMTATVSAITPASSVAPTGSVNFLSGGTVIGTSALSNGVATFASTTLAVGTDQLTAVYVPLSGASVPYTASTSAAVPVVITADPTALTISSSANPSPALTPVTFTAHLTINGKPAGAGYTVTFGVTPQSPAILTLGFTATTDATGTATFTPSGMYPGMYGVGASFAVTSTLQASASSIIAEVINLNPTSSTLIVAPNPGIQNNPVTLVASVAALAGSAPPNGTITLLDGMTVVATAPAVLGAGPLSSTTFTVTSLLPGNHTLSVSFTPTAGNSGVPVSGIPFGTPSGAVSFVGSNSVTTPVTILPQDFSFTANPPSITVETEHHGTMQLSLASIGGFSAPLTITCGTLPAEVTCELPNVPPSLPANGTLSVPLTLDTDALLNYVDNSGPRKVGGIALATLLPLMLAGLARKRSRLRGSLMMVALAVMTAGLGACSGKYPAHTPPGTYTIPLTATGTTAGSTGPTTHTLTVTLTVTP